MSRIAWTDPTVFLLSFRARLAAGAAVVFTLWMALATVAAADPRHGIAMHGEPALPAGFSAFPYVNPNAPKGGDLVQGVLGTFDSLNSNIVKGSRAIETQAYVIETLLTRGYDEPFTLYGLIARSVETDAERTYVTFHLDPRARFSDGVPVTSDDVVFSWRLLRDKGRPNHRTYYVKVARAQAPDPLTVRFDFASSDDRELPLILGLMPILPRHAVDEATFEDTSLKPPLGSGPYVFSAVDPGRSVTLTRNPDYWGRNLPVNRGRWNFDTLRFDFYRDSNAAFEAFKKGLYDVRAELDPSRWKTAYDFPAVRDGRVLQEALPSGLPAGMLGFVFNTRREVFADKRVREAITLLFDFEWINRNFFFGLYTRTAGYFDGSELSSIGRPADAKERALLAPFPASVRADVLAGTYAPPRTDGSGRDRDVQHRALTLLREAGFDLAGTELKRRTDGRRLTFEIMVMSKDQERLAIAFAQNLNRIGIAARIRVVDAVQYDQRRINFDFDMIQYRWDQSLSPGNEQAFYWGSAAAHEHGSRNYMGAENEAIDAVIAAMLKSRERSDFVAAVRALDRLLISGQYVVPLFHVPAQWVARWTHIERPSVTSVSGFLPETWWRRPAAP
ncbi:extracellular solute-binding protein [Astrobacterium formosum]|uniref:extracellular solute-binding protein n=1 Tax=Astrobacterium formosum TaxID=3069710 RepID=UPI003F50466A